MARPGASHRFGKYPKTCSVCAKPFAAKSSLATTCYEEACQRTRRSMQEHRRHKRDAQRTGGAA